MGATTEPRRGGATSAAAGGGSGVPELTIVAPLGAKQRAVQAQAQSVGSPIGQPHGFFEQRRKFVPEAMLQEIVDSAESLSKQHVALPKLDLGGLNLDACRKALRDMDAQRQSHLTSPGASMAAGMSGTAAVGLGTSPSLGPTQALSTNSTVPAGLAALTGQALGLQGLGGASSGTAAGSAGPNHATTAPHASAPASAVAARAATSGQAVSGLVKSALHIDVVKASVLQSFGPSLDRWFAVWSARSESSSATMQEAEGAAQHRLHKLPTQMSASQSLSRRYASCAGLDLSLPAVPITRESGRCGVSLAFVLHFAAHVAAHEPSDSHLTTRQVVKRYVLPRYPLLAARYCDTLPEAMVAHPRFLVSHRWDALFNDMVMQLARYFQGQDPEMIFLYIDIFSARQGHHPIQPPLPTGPPEALMGKRRHSQAEATSGHAPAEHGAGSHHHCQEVLEEAARQRVATFTHLQDIIKDVQQTLVILDHDALVLTRAWVLWEIWTTLHLHRNLSACVAVLGYGVQWSFVLQELVLRLHFETADASEPADIEYIHGHVGIARDGLAGASRAVVQAILKSATRQAKTAEKLLSTSHSSPTHFVGLRVQQAVMMRLEAKLQDAERSLWSTIDYMIRGLHGEPDDVGFAVGALVDVMATLDSPEELHRAAWLCLAAQERLEQHLGPDNVTCLRLAGSHVWALLRAGQVQAAEQLSQLTLRRQEALNRPVHELLDSLFTRATVQRVLGHADEAEGFLLRAVKLGEQRLGWGHPQCAVPLKLLGEWCHEAKRYEDAAVWLVQARAAMSRVYSRDSASWVRATLQLAQCMTRMDDLEAAEKLLLGLLKSGSNSAEEGKLGQAAKDGKEGRSGGADASKAGLSADPSTMSLVARVSSDGQPSSTSKGAMAAALAGHMTAAARRYSVAGSEADPEPEGRPSASGQAPMHIGLSEANLRRDMAGMMFEVLHQLLQVLVTSTQPGKLELPGPIPRVASVAFEGQSDSEEDEPDEELSSAGQGEDEPMSPSGDGKVERHHEGDEEHKAKQKKGMIDVPQFDWQALIAAGLRQSRRGLLASRAAAPGDAAAQAGPSAACLADGQQEAAGVMHGAGSRLSLQIPDRDAQPQQGAESASARAMSKSPSMVLLRSRSMQLKQPDAAALLQEELQHVEGLEGLTTGAWGTSPSTLPPAGPSQTDYAQAGGAATPSGTDSGVAGVNPKGRASDSGVRLSQGGSGALPGGGVAGGSVRPGRVSFSGDQEPEVGQGPSRRQSEAGKAAAGSQRTSDAGARRTSKDGTASIRHSWAGDGDPPRTMVDVFSEAIIIVSRLLYLFDQEKDKAEKAEAGRLGVLEGRRSSMPGIGPLGAGGKAGPRQGPGSGGDAADPSRPAGLNRQVSLYRRAMTDAGAAIWHSADATTGRSSHFSTALGTATVFEMAGAGGYPGALGGGVGPGHSIFSSQPHERKFKLRNRNLALALAPLANSSEGTMGIGAIARALLAAASGGGGNLDGTFSEPELRMTYGARGGRDGGWGSSTMALQPNASTACITLAVNSNRKQVESLPSLPLAQPPPAVASPTLNAETSSSSALFESLSSAPLVLGPTPPSGFHKSPKPLPPLIEQRRTTLLTLAHALQRHAAMLRVRGDEVGSALASQLGQAITHHMSGPGEPAAIASVASVIHLLVTRRRFNEAKQQLEYRLNMPAMTQSSKTSLKIQVGRHMTDVAFSAAAVGDVELLLQALQLGASTFKGNKQLLVLAAQKGQHEAVTALLKHEPTLADRPDADTGMRPLAVAAALGYRAILEDLLCAKVKVDLEALDSLGRTPLVHAVLGGRKSTAAALLAAGANTEVRFGMERISPLMAAAAAGHTKLIPLLVSHGANLEAVDVNERSAIFHAVMGGHMGTSSALLKAGADAGVKDREGCTPILYATRMEFLEMVALLAVHRQNVDLNIMDAKGWTPLHLAAAHGRTSIVDLLLSQGTSIRVQDHEGRTPLMLAAKNGHLSICVALLIHSAAQDGSHPVSIGDPDGQTAIQLRVDQALAKVGARVPTTAEVAKAIKEVDRVATLAMASADEATCLKALELLRHTAGRMALVRSYALMIDKTGRNAAGWAELSGNEQLAAELVTFTKRTL